MNTARASFTAAEGQSYGFRLVVKDPQGQQGVDTVTVTTRRPQPVQIVRFQASPDRIRCRSAEHARLAGTERRERHDHRNSAPFPATAIAQFSPTRTTQYRLTARNRSGEVTATTTVLSKSSPPRNLRLARFLR